MNDHLYRKLKRLFDNRQTPNGLDDYRRGLLNSKTTEESLKAEIERRGK